MSHRNRKATEEERRRRVDRERRAQQQSSESNSAYSDLESESNDDDIAIGTDEIAESIMAGTFDNLKTILSTSMAGQTVRQWNVEDEEIYTPNLHEVRGRALILNNHKFKRLRTRDGTNVDRERMFHLLKLLRYETTIKDNLRAKIPLVEHDYEYANLFCGWQL